MTATAPGRSAGSREAVPAAGRRSTLPALLLLVPALVVLAVLFVYPLLGVVTRSLGVGTHPGLQYYAIPVQHPVYLRVFAITFEIALTVTLSCLALGFPLAYAIATSRPALSRLFTLCVLLPFFTSLLVRTYAWMAILSPVGLLPQLLTGLGWHPVGLLYNRTAVVIAMTYSLLPYMVLTLYSVMRGIDQTLVRAAHTLGAGPWYAFRRIFLPLSLPGIAAGCILVFILALGYFVTPRLVGGPGDQMISMVIADEIDQSVDWGFASALTVMLLGVVLVGVLVSQRLTGLVRLSRMRL